MSKQIPSMIMSTYDAIQMSLWLYDNEPDSQNPRKLFQNTPVKATAEKMEDLPKHYSSNKLVDVRLGEMLGLGMIGAYSQAVLNKGFNVAISVDDNHKNQIENTLGDGGVLPMGEKDAMAVQQVSAQDYYAKDDASIQDIVISKVREKEARRSDYQKKCALLVNVFCQKPDMLNFNIVREKCDLNKFDEYFFALYAIPALENCRVIRLRKDGLDSQWIALDRDPDEHTPDQTAVAL